jgi:hypothetical protein
VFLSFCGMEDEGYFLALVRMFEQALKWVVQLPKTQRAITRTPRSYSRGRAKDRLGR